MFEILYFLNPLPKQAKHISISVELHVAKIFNHRQAGLDFNRTILESKDAKAFEIADTISVELIEQSLAHMQHDNRSDDTGTAKTHHQLLCQEFSAGIDFRLNNIGTHIRFSAGFQILLLGVIHKLSSIKRVS